MTDTTTSTKKRCIWGIVLFASFGLNLFLAGVLVGKPDAGPGMRSPMGRMGEQIEQLPPEHQKQAKAIFDSYRPEFKAQMKQVMSTRKELEALMGSKDYSRGAAQEKFFELSDEYVKLHQIGQQMTLEIADTLPPEERAKLLPRPRWQKNSSPSK